MLLIFLKAYEKLLNHIKNTPAQQFKWQYFDEARKAAVQKTPVAAETSRLLAWRSARWCRSALTCGLMLRDAPSPGHYAPPPGCTTIH